jgi:FlaA1/EpsC-like NDP-sugar epimerase
MLDKNKTHEKLLPISILFFIDALLTAFSFVVSYGLCSYILDDISTHSILIQLPIVVSLTSIIFLFIGIYKGFVKTSGLQEVYSIFNAICLANILTIVLVVINGKLILEEDLMVPLSIIIVHSILSFTALVISRLLYKILVRKVVIQTEVLKNVLLVHEFETNHSGLILLEKLLFENDRQVVSRLSCKTQSYAKEALKLKEQNLDFHEIHVMGTNSGNNDTSLLDKLTPLLGLNIPIFLLSPTKAREEMQSKTFDEVKLYKRLDIADLFPEQIEASYSYNRFGSSYYGKIILVTGAGGTIGSAFAKELFYSGVKATLILLDYSEKALSEIVTFMKNSDNLKIVPKLLDLKEKKSVEKIFENYKVSLVMHAAGNNFPESLNENISKVMQENLTTTKILADISNKAGIQKFIFCSTAGARHPRTTLEVSKRLAEIYLLSLNKNSNGTNFISVRLQCVYDSSGSGIGYLENQIAYNKPIDRSIFSEYELYSNKKDVAKALLLVANENTHFAQVALTLRLGFLVKTKVVANVVLNTKLSNTQKNIKIKVEYKNSFKNSSLGVNQVSNLESISLDKLFIEEKGLESNYSKSQIQQKIENLCINLLFDQNDISLIFDLIKDFNSNQWENLFKLQQEKSVPGKVIKLQSK